MPDVVLDPTLPAANQGLASLDALAAQAFALEPPAPSDLKDLLRDEAGLLLDGLLVRVARGRGALDVAIGEGLAALAAGDRTLRLGYSGIGDYARERLGIAGRTAQAMARLARELRERPILREAVRRGEVSTRKAEAVLPVARGEAEEVWARRARVETVRALQAAARVSGAAADEAEEERWDRISVPLSAEQRAKVDEAMALAGKILGASAPRWQRLEVMCQEFLAAHPVEPGEGERRSALGDPVAEWLEDAKLGLEQETRQWEFLASPAPVESEVSAVEDAASDPWQLDAELRRLAGMRDRWDSYEKARLVAWVGDDLTAEALISYAEKATCIALRREIEALEETQMCARGVMDLRVPRRADQLLGAAFRAAREAEGTWLEPGACLARIAEHFIRTWKPLLAGRSTRHRKVLARDRGYCQVPGCSRSAGQAHHVVYRSRGGGDEPGNLLSLCAAHHLHGVHAGYIRVSGTAPDALRWELGVRLGAEPLVSV